MNTPHLLHIFPYDNFSENEHWISNVDLLPGPIQDQVRAVVSSYGKLCDRGDRFEISRMPSEQELSDLAKICKDNDIEFISQIRTDQEWSRQTGKEFSHKSEGGLR